MQFSVRFAPDRSPAKIELESDVPTLHLLLSAIEKATGIPASHQILKAGFPPKTLEIAGSDWAGRAVSSVGLEDRDLIVMERSEAALRVVTEDKRTTSIEKPAAAGSGKSTRCYKINGFSLV